MSKAVERLCKVQVDGRRTVEIDIATVVLSNPLLGGVSTCSKRNNTLCAAVTPLHASNILLAQTS